MSETSLLGIYAIRNTEDNEFSTLMLSSSRENLDYEIGLAFMPLVRATKDDEPLPASEQTGRLACFSLWYFGQFDARTGKFLLLPIPEQQCDVRQLSINAYLRQKADFKNGRPVPALLFDPEGKANF